MENDIKPYEIAKRHVIGSLAINPMFLVDADYKLETSDFDDRLSRIIFGAIYYLGSNGATKISNFDIVNFLKQYPEQYKYFIEQKGEEYFEGCLQNIDINNYEYFYNVLKKYSLINFLNKNGFDTTDIYNPNITDSLQQSIMQEKFDKLTREEIIKEVELRLLVSKEKFVSESTVEECQAGEGVDEYLDELENNPDFGLPFLSPLLTLCFRGFRKGCLYLESGSTGTGKTRRQVSESAHLAISEYYDSNKKEWVPLEFQKPILYISTELKLKEVQTIWLSYITQVPETHILDNKMTPEEKERVLKGKEILKNAKLYFVSIQDYDIDDILNLIKKEVRVRKVEYVFYDYLSTTIKIMAESSKKTRMAGLREDQILLMFATQLKNVASSENIGIYTSTQLSGDWKNAKEADQQLLRGSRAIADKIDAGMILLPIRENDKPVVEDWLNNTKKSKAFLEAPTNVWHIFKVRRSKYNAIRIYINYNKDIMTVEDCFVSNNEGEILPIAPINVETILKENEVEKIDNALPSSSEIVGELEDLDY